MKTEPRIKPGTSQRSRRADQSELTVTAKTNGRAKAGTSRAAAEERRKLFVEAYLSNGSNGTQAAIAAGFSSKGADAVAARLLGDVRVSSQIAERTKKTLSDAQLSTERWAKEMAAIAHFDPGELFDKEGNLIPIKDLPEHVRRAIASIKPTSEGTEHRFHDKNLALANVGKHLGVFERDNHQQAQKIKVIVQLVG